MTRPSCTRWKTRTWTLVAAALLGAAPALAIEPARACVNTAFGGTPNCTANDLTFLNFDLGVQDDGCVSTSDTTTVILRSVITNTTAQTRYDVGLFFNTDGSGSALSGGQCAVSALAPVGPLNQASCPPLNLAGGSGRPAPGFGPYGNYDGDACGDMAVTGSPNGCDLVNNNTLAHAPDGVRDPVVVDFDRPITFSCADADANGFLEIPACLTWGQQSDEIGSNGTCGGVPDLRPGNAAKCRCMSLATRITVPRLGLTCSCAGENVFGFTDCTVSYTNSATCSSDPSKPPRDRCATASFVDFAISDGGVDGSFTNVQDGNGTHTTATGELVFTPNGDLSTTVGGVFYPLGGMVPESDTDSVTFRYQIPEGTTGTIDLGIDTRYTDRRCSNDTNRRCAVDGDCVGGGSCQTVANRCSNETSRSCVTSADCSGGGVCESGPVIQPTVQCNIGINAVATWASIAEVRARGASPGVEVSWSTSSEIGSVGFHVERLGSDGRFTRVSDELVPAVLHAAGGSYRFHDREADADGSLVYRLVEVEMFGEQRQHGPFTVDPHKEGTAKLARRDLRDAAGDSARQTPPSRAFVERREAARHEPVERRRVNATPAGIHSRRAKVAVADDGLYRLSLTDLGAALGAHDQTLSAALRSGRIRITEAGGQQVAWEADGRGLLFYGRGLDRLVTRDNVYWVTLEPGQRVAPLGAGGAGAAPDSFRDVARGEENLFSWHEITRDPKQDIWFWASLLAGHSVAGRAQLTLEAPSPDSAGAEATLELAAWGWSGSERYRAAVTVNGAPVGNVSWVGQDRAVTRVRVPASLLRVGPNEIEMQATAGGFFVDRLELAYDRQYRVASGWLAATAPVGQVRVDGLATPAVRVWEVSDPRRPRRLATAGEPAAGHSYAVSFSLPAAGRFVVATPAAVRPAVVRADTPSSLRDPEQRGEYLIVAPRQLLPAAEELAAFRQAGGLEALVVDLEDVMDELNGGVFDPAALRDLVAMALETWQLPPRWVVLVGRGHFDYLDHRGFGGNLLPPMMVGGQKGLVPADTAFGDVDGDGLPEVAVGRLPVLSNAELRAYLGRLAAYERTAGEPWRQQVLMIADDADPAGDFPRDTEHLSTRVPDGYRVEPLTLVGPAQVEAAREHLLETIGEGTLVVSFLGHGGLDRLATEGLLRSEDVARLDNGARAPLVLALTCNVGLFAIPGYSCLAEDLVMAQEGGAIAVLAPTGLSFNDKAVQLGERLLPAVLERSPRTVGEAVLDGMGAYVADGGDPSWLRVYNLFGDPAVVLHP